MQGWAGRYPSLLPFSSAKSWKGAFRSKPSEMGKSLNLLRENRHLSQCSWLLLGLSLYSYHVRELLVCWLYFTLLFVCLALVILGGVLTVYAGEWVTVWARTATRMTPVLALAPVKVPLKSTTDATKLH